MQMGVNGTGCGLIAYNYNILYKKGFGITGGWLDKYICTYSIVVMFTFNISLKDLILNIKAKSKGIKMEI